MKQFPKVPQILIQKPDGSVGYQPLANGELNKMPSSPWRPIGEFIDFYRKNAPSPFNHLVQQPA